MKIHSEPAFENRSFMVCDWKDVNGEFIFQERTYWPRRIFESRNGAKIICNLNTPILVEYWITRQIYKDFDLAKKEAKQFNFRAQESFYCNKDDKDWFPIFDDFEKCLTFLYKKSKVKYKSE